MSEIHIPDGMFVDFEKTEMDPDNTDSGPGPGPEDRKIKALESLSKSTEWICTIIDNGCKENELPGFGKMKIEDYSKLLNHVIEKNLSDALLEKSPELTLSIVTAGIVTQNLVALSKKRKKEPADGES